MYHGKIRKKNVDGIKSIHQIVKNSGGSKEVNWLNDVQVPHEHKEKMIKFLKNEDLFAAKDSELGHTKTVEMKIETGDQSPIKLRPYRTPIHNREVVDKAIDEMLEAGVIRRSKSAWSFSVVIVDKKDGSKRFCVET